MQITALNSNTDFQGNGNRILAGFLRLTDVNCCTKLTLRGGEGGWREVEELSLMKRLSQFLPGRRRCDMLA